MIPDPWRERQSGFGADELVELVVRASRNVARAYPDSVAAVGDLSRRSGGGSAEHKSHQSGRDVDVFYYALNAAGHPEPPRNVMFHFDQAGRALRWSPPQGTRPPPGAIPQLRFDVARNWRFVRALLRDPAVEVQWIFVQRDLAVRMIQQGFVQGDDAALMARAAQIMRQPSDSEPHDDHMHVRIYCDPDDRALGCDDHGPVRWWKKRWKYMTPPFLRTADAAAGVSETEAAAALLHLLRSRQELILGQPRLTS